MHRPDTDADANADEEGEAREWGDLSKDEELIGRGGYDIVYAAGGQCRGDPRGETGGQT